MSNITHEIRANAEAYKDTPVGWSLQLRLEFAQVLCDVCNEYEQFGDFADKIGLGHRKAENLLKGNHNVTLDEIGRICHVLGVKVTLVTCRACVPDEDKGAGR